MIKIGSFNLRGVVILEFAAILVVLAILGFLGLNYVNNHQKLASTATQATPTKKPAVSTSDIKPIKNTATLEDTASQLNKLQTELDSSECLGILLGDINSITN